MVGRQYCLSFSQISQFCQLHELEVQSIADGEDAYRMQGLNPIASGQLTMDEIKRCEGDHSLELQLQNKKSESIQSSVKTKNTYHYQLDKKDLRL